MVDGAIRLAYWIGFRAARTWWQLRHPDHTGALVAVWVGDRVLLLRQSYQPRLTFPGGGVAPGEAPAEAAARELVEELALVVAPDQLTLACVAHETWDGRRDTVSFFELRLPHEPKLHLDRREIVGSVFVTPHQAPGRVSDPVAHYLRFRLGGPPSGSEAARPTTHALRGP